jgi:hypothetical protein
MMEHQPRWCVRKLLTLQRVIGQPYSGQIQSINQTKPPFTRMFRANVELPKRAELCEKLPQSLWVYDREEAQNDVWLATHRLHCLRTSRPEVMCTFKDSKASSNANERHACLLTSLTLHLKAKYFSLQSIHPVEAFTSRQYDPVNRRY